MMDNSQQISLESRINLLETKIRDLEARLLQLEGSPQTQRTMPDLQKGKTSASNGITVELLNKTFRQADYMVGDSGDSIDFSLQFKNHLSKDVRAFTGQLIFRDLFDREILRVNLTDETGIRSGSTSQWQGGISYNQFFEEHNRLLSISKSDLTVEFLVEQVIYKDGTKESFNS